MSELNWRRPCDSGTCVEVAVYPNAVYVRDSKLDPSPVLHYEPDAWRKLLDQAREDRWVDDVWYPCDWRADPEEVWWRGDGGDLYFTRGEIDAFIAGVATGEFDLPEVTA